MNIKENVSPLEQLRATRTYAMNAWCAGGDGSRWLDDDGRILKMAEFAFWPLEIQEAEQAYFIKQDEIYEAEKIKLNEATEN